MNTTEEGGKHSKIHSVYKCQSIFKKIDLVRGLHKRSVRSHPQKLGGLSGYQWISQRTERQGPNCIFSHGGGPSTETTYEKCVLRWFIVRPWWFSCLCLRRVSREMSFSDRYWTVISIKCRWLALNTKKLYCFLTSWLIVNFNRVPHLNPL